MYVRMNVVIADPEKLDESIKHAATKVAPLVATLPGNRGMLMSVDRELGRGVVTTMWDSLDALQASEAKVTNTRADAGRIAGGAVDVYVLEVLERHMLTDPQAGCWQRATTLAVDEDNIDTLTDTFRTSTLPALDAMDGFCGAVLLLDRESGRCIVVATWRDHDALTASTERVDSLRQEVRDKAHGTVMSVEEREVVFAEFR